MKKILLILENHTDYRAIPAHTALITYLLENGYNTLCLEFTFEGPVTAFEAHLAQCIDRVKKDLLPQTLRGLAQAGLTTINSQPIDAQTVQNLEPLALCYVLNERKIFKQEQIGETALALTTLRHVVMRHELTKKFMGTHDIFAIDKPRFAASSKEYASAEQFAVREAHMANALEAIYKANGSSVFMVGKGHAPGLLKELRNKGLLADVGFIDVTADASRTHDEKYQRWKEINKKHIYHYTIDKDFDQARHFAAIARSFGIDAITSVKQEAPRPRPTKI